MPDRARGKTRGGSPEPWERRLLAYAHFCAESALSGEFLRQLSRMVRLDFPYLVSVIDYDRDGEALEVHSARIAPSLEQEYVDYYQYINPFRNIVNGHRLGNQTAAFDHFLPARELRKTEYYNDLMTRIGVDNAMALSIAGRGGSRTSISIYRSAAEGGPFEDHEVTRLDQLRPFLESALLLRQLWLREREQRNGRDAVAIGVTKERIVPLNDAAEERLLGRAGSSAAGNNNLVRFPATPLPGATMPPGVSSILVERGPTSECATELRKSWDLTPKEAEVAVAVLEGCSYQEIADRLGVSFNTVATHMKSLRAKIGVSSTRQLLVRLTNRH